MTSFFEYLETSRPTAAVAKNTAGSNSPRSAVSRFRLGVKGLGLGVRDITAFHPFRRELNGLSVTAPGVPLLVIPICMLPDTKVQDPEIGEPKAESDLFAPTFIFLRD